MSQMSDRNHALLAILLLLLFLSPLVLIPVELWDKWQEYDEHIERSASSLQRYKGLLASKDTIEKETALYKSQLEGNYFFPANRAPALVAGDMQKKINSLADTHKAMVNSTRVLTVVAGEQWLRHGISVNMRGSIESARAVLHGLADSRPLMEMDKLVVRGSAASRKRRKTRRGKPIKQVKAKREVTLTFELHAWQLK